MTPYGLPDRLQRRITVHDDTTCWEWDGGLNPDGYGRVWWEGRGHRAHRVVYMLLVGEIADGMQIDHLCRNRACVNPDHLEPVTNRDNTLRGESPMAVAYRTGMCGSGRHEMTGENVFVRRDGIRNCRTCRNEAKARRWRERYATDPAFRDALRAKDRERKRVMRTSGTEDGTDG